MPWRSFFALLERCVCTLQEGSSRSFWLPVRIGHVRLSSPAAGDGNRTRSAASAARGIPSAPAARISRSTLASCGKAHLSGRREAHRIRRGIRRVNPGDVGVRVRGRVSVGARARILRMKRLPLAGNNRPVVAAGRSRCGCAPHHWVSRSGYSPILQFLPAAHWTLPSARTQAPE